MKAKTDWERVLELLQDGRPHSYREVYALAVMGHSRISDLRKRGYDITCDKTGGDYVYTLQLGQMSLDVDVAA